ncbi:MAG: ATPase, T2SS/T4P/T4SS family [Candidatus Aenigmatarchaeota archaeon]
MDIRIEENKLIIKISDKPIVPIEDSRELMKICIEQLIQNKNVLEIIIQSLKELEYPYEQTKLLREIAETYEEIIKNRINVPTLKEVRKLNVLQKFFDQLNSFIEEIKEDIISSYKKLLLFRPKLLALYEKTKDDTYLNFIKYHIEPLISILEKNFFVKVSKDKNIKIGDRSVYREYLNPIIRPIFLETKFYILPPKNSIRLAKYKVRDFEVEIFKVPNKVRPLYMILAPEFFLSDEEIKILERVRAILAEHKVSEEELKDFEKTREAFFNLERDLIKKVSAEMNIPLTEKRIEELTNILLKYTVGYGILERFVADENITDIYINSPIGSKPVFIQHSEFEECETNIIISPVEAENWATKFRLYSGRPLDEANPVLDTELNLPEGRARVAITTRPLTPEGLSFAFRRHRDKPWTLPLFIKKKMINSLFAGLMNFIVSGARSFLVAGGRGSGKTSLLQALMLEIPKKYRIIVLEDTLELPVPQMREIGYNIERLKARSVITRVESELPAEEALRTALRLGDSALIIGEIRSTEALTLFEAMRIGALAHVVAGTIHGESAYGVFDRVVNDLKVPKTSFKAVDLIIITANLKSADGIRRFKRVVEVIEVRKNWEDDPLRENAFIPLMIYNAKEDNLIPTPTLINGESFVIREIMRRVPEFHGNWDLVWENIMLRAKIKEKLIEFSEKYNKPELLEAEYVVLANEYFHLISEEVKRELGYLDSKEILRRWEKQMLEFI